MLFLVFAGRVSLCFQHGVERTGFMLRSPQLDPDVGDEAPTGPDITAYDEHHYVTYLRLLDRRRALFLRGSTSKSSLVPWKPSRTSAMAR